ncbi:hypothetical protein QR685DRAFT_554951 [Neurospora intermedia]|uniref:5'-3' DNA helicase ZGRF1-like N-terminal domain-containing protein n=1 Tax=Neurospora intermedia TaxID=5142 RepID=A0ABR3D7Z7_NEUIN
MASVVSSGRSDAGANETSSTAEVLEFLCLFTHDLKRKQKRWQDGRLKYHTFNRRVMVYDDRGNYVGDMHWRRDWDFDEGEEIELERGGVIVQVAECVARQQQDLSELIDKRAKEKEQRQALIASRPARPTPAHTPLRVTPRNNAQQDHFQLRHRPLNQLLGTPTGHHGRALVPDESPFEQRNDVGGSNDGADSSRPSKRRRYEDTPPSKMGYAQSLFGASLTLSGAPASSALLRRPVVAKVQTRREPSPPQEAGPRQQVQSDAPTRTTHATRPNRMTAVRLDNMSRPRPAPAAPPEEGLFVSQEDYSDPVWETSSNRDDQRHHTEDSNTRPHGRSSFVAGPTTSEAAYSSKSLQIAKGKGTLLSSIGKGSALLNNNKNATSVRPRLTYSKQDKQTIILDRDDDDDGGDENDDGRKQRNDASPPPRSVIGGGSKRAAPVAGEIHDNKRKKTTSVKKSVTDKGARQKPQNEPDPVTTQDEPMAELKIKSRQKRGLLVLSEKPKRAQRPAKSPIDQVAVEPMETRTTNDKSAVHQQSVPDDSDDDPFAFPMPVIDTILPRKDKSRESRRPEVLSESHRDRPVANQDQGESAAVAATNSQASPAKNRNQQEGRTSMSDSDYTSRSHHSHAAQNKENAQPKEVKAKKNFKPPEPKGKAHIEVDSEKEDEEISRYPRRRRTTRIPASPVSSDESKTDEPESAAESADEELPQVPVGPRLAKLARKSIKSREVIGFVPSSSPVINIHKQAEPVPGHIPGESRLVAEESSTLHSSNTKDDITPQSPKVAVAEDHTGRTEKPELMLPLSVLKDAVDPASLQQPNGVSEKTSLVVTSSDSNNVTPGDGPSALLTDKQAPSNILTDHTSNVANETSGNVPASDAASATVRKHKLQLAQKIKEPPLPMPDQAGCDDGSAGTKEFRAKGETAMPPSHESRVTDKRQTDIAVSVPVPLDGSVKTMSPVDNSSTSVATARIVNPATRGRKAALKSHAAGQVPQSILPAEPAPARIVPRNRELSRHKTTGSGAEERPKRKMTFPGFTSAREGGPWSREAHDLLETGRPV